MGTENPPSVVMFRAKRDVTSISRKKKRKIILFNKKLNLSKIFILFNFLLLKVL